MGALRDFVADAAGERRRGRRAGRAGRARRARARSGARGHGLAGAGAPRLRGRAPARARSPIGLEGDWLDRFGALLGERGRWAERQLPSGRPCRAAGRSRTSARARLDLPNAVWRLPMARRPAGRAACCWPSATPPSPTRSARGWSGSASTIGTGAVLDDILARLRPLLLAQDCRVAGAGRRDMPPCRRSAWDAATLRARVAPLLEHDGAARARTVPARHAPASRSRSQPHPRLPDDLRGARSSGLPRLPMRGREGRGRPRRETMRVAAIEREYARQARRPAPQLRAARDGRLGAGVGVVRAGAALEVLIRRRKGERLDPARLACRRLRRSRAAADASQAWASTRAVSSATIVCTSPSPPARRRARPAAKSWCRACSAGVVSALRSRG